MKNLDQELNRIKNKKLLIVFPHPDDEAVMAGGLIRRAVGIGFRVMVVCLTKGELGKIYINGSGRSTAQIRDEEFKKSMAVLGINESSLWNYPDGGLRKSSSWRRQLSDLVDRFQPSVLVTYDPSGITGHPDHVALAMEMLSLVKTRKGTRLWWPSLFGEARKMIVDVRVADLLPKPSFRLGLSLTESLNKWQAISAHASQGWTKVGTAWVLCLGWLLRHRYEDYAEADLERNYEHRYVKFKF